jgi:hypothetical protein
VEGRHVEPDVTGEDRAVEPGGGGEGRPFEAGIIAEGHAVEPRLTEGWVAVVVSHRFEDSPEQFLRHRGTSEVQVCAGLKSGQSLAELFGGQVGQADPIGMPVTL